MNRQGFKKSLSKLRNRLSSLARDMQQQLKRQATHDNLTQLPNQVLFKEGVEQAILEASKNHLSLACLFLDLDRFKLTNDTIGHSIGDKLLQAVAERLLTMGDETNLIARFGGDEFIILMPYESSQELPAQFAEKLLATIRKPYKIGPYSIKITASVGISIYPQDGPDYESLMKHADLAMYEAKENGRNTYRLFYPELKSRALSRLQMDTALRGALKNKEFHLVYQPLIDIKNNCVVGLEALLRWDNPVLGVISPLDFIPVAEETGLIIDIGSWVLEEACEQLMRWHKQGLSTLIVSVNMSSRQFHQPNLPMLIETILTKTGLPPQFLELEITERVLLENIDKLLDTMNQLKQLGVKLSIDDFGTGYSNLSYLKRFPVDKLKIDQSFIMEIVSNSNNIAIVNAIINLAHCLNLEVLAEGIETEFQKNFIIDSQCDYGQGYFFKIPEKPEDLQDYLFAFAKKN